jgi:hypothetical protein
MVSPPSALSSCFFPAWREFLADFLIGRDVKAGIVRLLGARKGTISNSGNPPRGGSCCRFFFFRPAESQPCIRVVLKQNSQRFFSADLSCESASHHFELFFFETGSLVGFVVLKLPQYFLQRARKLAQIVVLKLITSYFLQHARKLAQNLLDLIPD